MYANSTSIHVYPSFTTRREPSTWHSIADRRSAASVSLADSSQIKVNQGESRC